MCGEADGCPREEGNARSWRAVRHAGVGKEISIAQRWRLSVKQRRTATISSSRDLLLANSMMVLLMMVLLMLARHPVVGALSHRSPSLRASRMMVSSAGRDTETAHPGLVTSSTEKEAVITPGPVTSSTDKDTEETACRCVHYATV